MKLPKPGLAASIALLSLCGLQAGPDARAAVSLGFEASDPKDAFVLDSRNCSLSEDGALSGQRSLRVDSRGSKSEWNGCLKTAPGLLKPVTSYVASFKCKLLAEPGPDSFLYFLVRPFDADDASRDLWSLPVMDAGILKELRVKFRTPAKSPDCSFQISSKHGVLALVDDIRIEEGSGELVIPVKEELNAPESQARDPKGCPDFEVALPSPAKPLEISVADFGASSEIPDNSEAFRKAVERCASAEGGARLRVPKGVYRFASEEPLLFAGLKDFEFDGEGSTFIFSKGRGSLFKIESCARALFKGFSVDWDWERDPIGSVVRLESAKDGRLDFRFVDYKKFPKIDVRVAVVEELDPETMSVGCEGAVARGFEFHKGKSQAPKTEWLSGNTLRIALDAPDERFQGKEGSLFRMRHYVYDVHGFAMRDNTDLTLSGIELLSCPGHGFLCSGEQCRWQLLNVKIVRPPGSARPITCSADHCHVEQSKGFLKLEGCEFSFGGDDCLNVHDSSGFGVKSGPRTLKTRNLRYSQSYHEGDLIELRNDDLSPAGLSSRIKAIKRPASANDGWSFEFEDELPAQKGSGFVLFNRRYASGNVLVRNCFFHDNEARGLLLSGENVTVEGCRFRHNEKCAINIQTGYTTNSWCEGYGASNVVIRGNSFENPNPRGAYEASKAPAIFMDVYLRRDPSLEKTSFPILKDILIEGNRFADAPGACLYAASASNVKFRDNRVENSKPRKEELPFRGSVAAECVSGLDVRGNIWRLSESMPEPGIIVDPLTTSGVSCSANKVLRDRRAAP